MDKGPWKVYNQPTLDAVCVVSEDFEHDVMLRITGDFADRASKVRYAEWLASVLNDE